ncbi:helix-turn-helix domain-containing protein [Saccharothrix sp. BKS2]|uniref:helix-turn-helix domain-containing protein n=1 Tax=Saccharothrix sp. BKS2 TaxID=3064400 RepID=UPI0039E844C6
MARGAVTQAQRLQAVRRVLGGERPDDVARRYGVSRAAVFRWAAAYRRDGEAALCDRKAPGRRPLLSPGQRDEVRNLLLGLEPVRAGFSRQLWTKAMVRQVCRERFGVELSQASTTRFLVGERLLPPADQVPSDAGALREAARSGLALGSYANLPHHDGVALSVTWTNRSSWFGLYRGACPGAFSDFCVRLVEDSRRPVLLVGAPPLRELATTARELAGRLVLWQGGGAR